MFFELELGTPKCGAFEPKLRGDAAVAYKTHTLARVQRLTERLQYRHLLVATVMFVYATIILGVSAKATGAGLACDANWPLCDGGLLNLFPASMPSFFEWIHRVVAMVAGFFILGAGVAALRGYADDRRISGAVAAGTILLPVQVLLGRQTVIQYEVLVQTAHYWVAMTIFGAFVAAVALAWRDVLNRRHAALALSGALVLLPVEFALGPQIVSSYSAPVQAAHYAVILLVFASLLGAVLIGREYADRGATVAMMFAFGLLPVQVLIGRQVITGIYPLAGLAHYITTVAVFVAALAAFVRFSRQ